MTLSTPYIAGIVGVIVGVIVFIVGSRLVRSSEPLPDVTVATAETAPVAPVAPSDEETALQWTREITGDESDVEPAVRIDMIERLAMVGLPWCEALLQRAADEERDLDVLDAAERALLVVRARPISAA